MITEHQAVCTGCQKTMKAKPTKDGSGVKCPMGWRSIADALLCGECVRARYYVRGFRVAIRGVVGSEKDSRDTVDFRASLVAAAKATARFANWYVQRLYAADLAAAPSLAKTKDGKVKLPKAPEVDFYRAATIAFPEMAPASIVAAAKMIRGWYVADRYQVFVQHSRSVRSYRFGDLPVEIPKQAWTLVVGDDGKMAIRTQVGPGKSWHVDIYADPISRSRLKAIDAGEAVPLALKLVRANRTQTAGGGARPQKAWYFRISAMFPRKAPRKAHQEITLTLGHDPGVLLYGVIEGDDDAFEFPGDALRRIVVGGDKSDKRRQQEHSLARAAKWSKRQLARWGKDRTRVCENRTKKVAYQMKLAAASLARWCVQKGVTSVDYDAQDRGFLPHCPWYALRSAIDSALEREGVALHVTTEPEETNQAAFVGPEQETSGG